MEQVKVCPICELVNPPSEQQCDCGYHFELLGNINSGTGCQICGCDAELRHVSFHQHTGMLVLWIHRSIKGKLCKSCISRHFWEMTTSTMCLGWWGMISFIITPICLINNIGRYIYCLGMSYDTPTSSSKNDPEQQQLVGQNCIQCGEPIPSILKGCFCQLCGSPVHNRCVRQGGKAGCPECGTELVST